MTGADQGTDLTPAVSHGLTMQKLKEIKSLLIESQEQIDECLQNFERRKAEDFERRGQKGADVDIMVKQLQEITDSRRKEKHALEQNKDDAELLAIEDNLQIIEALHQSRLDDISNRFGGLAQDKREGHLDFVQVLNRKKAQS